MIMKSFSWKAAAGSPWQRYFSADVRRRRVVSKRTDSKEGRGISRKETVIGPDTAASMVLYKDGESYYNGGSEPTPSL